MKFSLPMYDGDSFIRRGSEPESDLLETQIQGDSTPEMLQRKITPPEPEPMVFDRFEIERQARALRAAAIRSAMASFWNWVERSFETARRRRTEEYLARAQSVPELETRLRQLERGAKLVRI